MKTKNNAPANPGSDRNTDKNMDTSKLSMGWAVIIVSGLIQKETAKLKRAIVKRGAHKLAPKTYARRSNAKIRRHAATRRTIE